MMTFLYGVIVAPMIWAGVQQMWEVLRAEHLRGGKWPDDDR